MSVCDGKSVVKRATMWWGCIKMEGIDVVDIDKPGSSWAEVEVAMLSFQHIAEGKWFQSSSTCISFALPLCR